MCKWYNAQYCKNVQKSFGVFLLMQTMLMLVLNLHFFMSHFVLCRLHVQHVIFLLNLIIILPSGDPSIEPTNIPTLRASSDPNLMPSDVTLSPINICTDNTSRAPTIIPSATPTDSPTIYDNSCSVSDTWPYVMCLYDETIHGLIIVNF